MSPTKVQNRLSNLLPAYNSLRSTARGARWAPESSSNSPGEKRLLEAAERAQTFTYSAGGRSRLLFEDAFKRLRATLRHFHVMMNSFTIICQFLLMPFGTESESHVCLKRVTTAFGSCSHPLRPGYDTCSTMRSSNRAGKDRAGKTMIAIAPLLQAKQTLLALSLWPALQWGRKDTIGTHSTAGLL